MSQREQILYLLTRFNIPFWHAGLSHLYLHLLPFGTIDTVCLAFTHMFHDFIRHSAVHSLFQKGIHNIFTGTDQLLQCTRSFFDQFLSVAFPGVRSVKQCIDSAIVFQRLRFQTGDSSFGSVVIKFAVIGKFTSDYRNIYRFILLCTFRLNDKMVISISFQGYAVCSKCVTCKSQKTVMVRWRYIEIKIRFLFSFVSGKHLKWNVKSLVEFRQRIYLCDIQEICHKGCPC